MLCLGVALTGAVAHAACSYPRAPQDLPDGNTATTEQMLTAQNAVKEYVAAIEQYLDCLDAEVAALGDAASEERILMRDKRHNAAIDAMDKTASEFNQAVRQYKARDN
jgi:hypothetical protein